MGDAVVLEALRNWLTLIIKAMEYKLNWHVFVK